MYKFLFLSFFLLLTNNVYAKDEKIINIKQQVQQEKNLKDKKNDTKKTKLEAVEKTSKKTEEKTGNKNKIKPDIKKKDSTKKSDTKKSEKIVKKNDTKKSDTKKSEKVVKKDNTKKSDTKKTADHSQSPFKQFKKKVIKHAMNYIGTKYKFGGSNPETGFDCSGLMRYVHQKYGINLPRTSREQYASLYPVSKPNAGDLVFFNHENRPVNHVGLYLGNGKMLHAPQSGEVVRIENIETPYWKRRYVGARSVISPEKAVIKKIHKK